jgi:Pseudouridine synthase II TruB, C-terminal.
VYLSDQEAIAIKYGQSIRSKLELSLGLQIGSLRMYHGSDFLGLGEMQLDGKIAPKKIFNINT